MTVFRNQDFGRINTAQLIRQRLRRDFCHPQRAARERKPVQGLLSPYPCEEKAGRCRLCLRGGSVSVPGVTIRVTCRSTGPLASAGSPICSAIATDCPSFTSLARYCSTECTGTPAIFTGAPADDPRCARQVEQALDLLGVVVEELVEVPHPVEHQDVGVSPLMRKYCCIIGVWSNTCSSGTFRLLAH